MWLKFTTVRKPSLATWSMPAPIPVQTLLPSSEPNMVIGSDGLPHVIWVIATPQNNAQIVYSTRAADGTWSTVVAITDEFAMAAGGKAKPQFAAGPDSTLHVTYNAANGGYYLNGVIGGSWSTPALLNSRSISSRYPNWRRRNPVPCFWYGCLGAPVFVAVRCWRVDGFGSSILHACDRCAFGDGLVG